MAAQDRSSIPRLGMASTLWLAVTAALCIAALALAWKLVFGQNYRAQALADVQRIEFDLRYQDGNAIPQNLEGETLSRETAKAMSEAAVAVPTAPPVATEAPEQPAGTDVPPQPDMPAPDAEPEPSEEPEAVEEPQTAPPAETPVQTPEEQPSGPTAELPVETPASTATPKSPILAPVEKMTEAGIIPAIAADGTKPWQYFAKQDYAKSSGNPRIAVIIRGLGMAQTPTESAIALPPEVTLAFSPYGRVIAQDLAESARASGHELMLDLPMQTERYPAVDPGPYGLRTDLSPAENNQRLMRVLTELRGYVGLLAPSRDTLSLDRTHTAPLIDGFAGQGLLFVSGYSQQPEGMFRLTRQAGVPILFTDIALDDRVSESYIRNQLARAEDTAHNQGHALVVGHAYPITLELLENWTRELAAKGFTLVPVTALAAPEQE